VWADMPHNARIIVVEDEPSLRDDLVDYLNLRGFTALGAATAHRLEELLSVRAATLVVLDIGLPDRSGLDMVPWLRQHHPDAGIVMLTAFGDAPTRVASLDGGADAYLVKGASLEVIEATCTAVIRRLHPRAHPQPTVAAGTTSAPVAGPLAVSPEAATDTAWIVNVGVGVLRGPAGGELSLTLMEQNFLVQLMVAPGQIVSRKQILAALSRPDTLNNLRNLDGCVARLRRKVEQDLGESLPVRSSYGQGYAFTGRGRLAR
jgi:two-component system OmpR family response regulator